MNAQQNTVTDAKDWRVVEQMMRPQPLVSDSRKEGCLQYATYKTEACGCKVTGNGSLPYPLEVKLCAMHAAAQDMLLAIEKFIELGKSGGDTSWYSQDAQPAFYAMMVACRKAKGEA